LAAFPALSVGKELLLSYIGNAAMAGFLVSCCALGLIWCTEHVSVRRGLTLGVVLGFTCLTHAGALLFVPLSAMMIVIRSGLRSTRGWLAAATVFGIAALVISPWTFRNWMTFGKFVPVRSGLGQNLHYAMPALAQTFSSKLQLGDQWDDPPWTAASAFQALSIVRQLGPMAAIFNYSIHTIAVNAPDGYDRFNEAQQDAVFLSHTIAFVFANPLLVMEMITVKAMAFFFTNWRYLGFVTAIAFIVAIIMLKNQRTKVLTLLILAYAFPYTLSAPIYYRYRYPVEPLLFVLVGLSMGAVIALWRSLPVEPAGGSAAAASPALRAKDHVSTLLCSFILQKYENDTTRFAPPYSGGAVLRSDHRAGN
jgi:hypothetical protein